MAAPLRITSPDNPKVKDAIRLRSRRARTTSRRLLVEGRREVRRALDAGLPIEHLFVEDTGPAGADPAVVSLARSAEQAGARIFPVNAAVSAKLALREGAEGVVAVFGMPDAPPGRLRLPERPLVLAASAIEKPGNVGALLRSADAFGVSAFVTEGGTDLWNPNVIRASLGCVFTVPVAALPAGELVPWLRALSLRVIAATPDAAAAPSEVDFRGAVAILVGSEESGLPSSVLASADARVRIPMRGHADSLNVSVSAGILLYEADRQRAARR
jgi:TrmH family RNA methyltransferase